jgi:hypothetical protein
VRAQKFGQARLQPFRGEARTGRDHEVACLRLRRDQMGRIRYQLESMLDFSRVGAPCARQDGATGMALKQPHTEKILQLLDVVADRRGRNAEILGTPREAAVASGGFEGQQRPERRQSGSGLARG